MDCMQESTALLLGDSAVAQLSKAHVMVIGLGGVGGTAAEALCRSGVGRLTLVDGDRVSSFQLKSSDRSCSEYRGLAQSDGYEKKVGRDPTRGTADCGGL